VDELARLKQERVKIGDSVKPQLDDLLKSGGVDETTLKQIQQIAPIEETTRVTLSKVESKER